MATINWINSIDEAKKNKLVELNGACSMTISGRFTATVNNIDYQFSCDSEAQSNFEKTDRAFDKTRITEINWTAYDVDGNVVRLLLDNTTFEGVYMAHLQHIQDNVSKFRDTLMPLVESASTVDEVNAIIWS
jgi:hypothetical protein